MQQDVQVAVSKADQLADDGDRDAIGDRRHEIAGASLKQSLNAAAGDKVNLAIEQRHAFCHKLREDRAFVQRVQGRIGGGEHLNTHAAEGQEGRKAVLPTVKQAGHVRRKIFDPPRGFFDQGISTDDEQVGSGRLPHRRGLS